MNELTPVRRERIQNRITKVVVSDEPEEKLEAIIQANEMIEEDAAKMIQNARKIRIDIIRGVAMRKVWIGGAVLALGIGTLYVILIIVGVLSKATWVLGGFIAAMGITMVLGGILSIVLAPSKRGSFIDHL